MKINHCESDLCKVCVECGIEYFIFNGKGGHLQFKSNLVSLFSKSLEPVVDMHNNDCVICSCTWSTRRRTRDQRGIGSLVSNPRVCSAVYSMWIGHGQEHGGRELSQYTSVGSPVNERKWKVGRGFFLSQSTRTLCFNFVVCYRQYIYKLYSTLQNFILLLLKNRMNERVIFAHNPLDQSTLKLLVFLLKSNQIIGVKIKAKYPCLLMLRVHNRGVGNSTPQRSFRIHNFNGAILLKVELRYLSFKGSVTTHFEKFTHFEKKNSKCVKFEILDQLNAL